jgi:hypothetical protein
VVSRVAADTITISNIRPASIAIFDFASLRHWRRFATAVLTNAVNYVTVDRHQMPGCYLG